MSSREGRRGRGKRRSKLTSVRSYELPVVQNDGSFLLHTLRARDGQRMMEERSPDGSWKVQSESERWKRTSSDSSVIRILKAESQEIRVGPRIERRRKCPSLGGEGSEMRG